MKFRPSFTEVEKTMKKAVALGQARRRDYDAAIHAAQVITLARRLKQLDLRFGTQVLPSAGYRERADFLHRIGVRP